MFALWHWAGIQGVIRTYFKLNHSPEYAAKVIDILADTLAREGVESMAKDYAINLAKRFRSMGCDKASAYMAAANAYASEAFKLDPERCKFVTL